MEKQINFYDKEKIIGKEESGSFLIISPAYGESAIVVKEGERVTYVVTSFGVGLSELGRLRQYRDAHVYRLDNVINLDYINYEILGELKKQASSPIPIMVVASNDLFIFEVLLKDGKMLDITAYFKEHIITGFTALRLLVSSELNYIDKYESVMPDVVKLNIPVNEILTILRIIPAEKAPDNIPKRSKSVSKKGTFTRIINGMSIREDMWNRYIQDLSETGFTGAASSSEGHLVILREGRVVEEHSIEVDYQCEHFRVWAMEFDSDYEILNNVIRIGYIELYLPHFLSRMEIEGHDVEFFLFAGFEYDIHLTSEILARWNRAFVSFFDDLDIVDFSGLNWIVIDVDRVRIDHKVLEPYLDRIIFVGDPGIPRALKLEKPFSRESFSRILEQIASRDPKREELLICSEVKTLIEKLKRHVITWPVELSKIRMLTGVDPDNLESCTQDALEKLKKFLEEHYGI